MVLQENTSSNFLIFKGHFVSLGRTKVLVRLVLCWLVGVTCGHDNNVDVDLWEKMFPTETVYTHYIYIYRALFWGFPIRGPRGDRGTSLPIPWGASLVWLAVPFLVSWLAMGWECPQELGPHQRGVVTWSPNIADVAMNIFHGINYALRIQICPKNPGFPL